MTLFQKVQYTVKKYVLMTVLKVIEQNVTVESVEWPVAARRSQILPKQEREEVPTYRYQLWQWQKVDDK